MKKFMILFLIGLALASILPMEISSAAGSKVNVGRGKVAKVEGYQLTPADKHSQLVALLLILTIIILAP